MIYWSQFRTLNLVSLKLVFGANMSCIILLEETRDNFIFKGSEQSAQTMNGCGIYIYKGMWTL